MNINKKNIIAMMLVYGITRGVIDNVKPASDDEMVTTDTTVFQEVMKSLHNKEVEVNNVK